MAFAGARRKLVVLFAEHSSRAANTPASMSSPLLRKKCDDDAAYGEHWNPRFTIVGDFSAGAYEIKEQNGHNHYCCGKQRVFL